MFDFIAKSVFTTPAAAGQILIMLAAAAAAGILDSLLFSRKSRMTDNMKLTLVLIPVVESIIVFLVNGNLGTGIAVAGSFALVRFRSIPGNGKEITAIFTDMAFGLMIGMGYVGMAAVFFVIMTVIVIGYELIFSGRKKMAVRQMRITVPEDMEFEGLFDDILKENTEWYELVSIRTKNMGTLFELIYNMNMKDLGDCRKMIDAVRMRNGNLKVSIGLIPDERRL